MSTSSKCFFTAQIIVVAVALGVLTFTSYQVQAELSSLSRELEATKLRAEQATAAATLDGQFIAVVETLQAEAGGNLEPHQITDVAKVITGRAEIHRDIGLTPSLVLAVMKRESRFDPDARSSYGARGIMQVIRSTAEPHLEQLGYEWGQDILEDPVVCTKVGIRELVRLHRMFMDEGLEKRDEWKFSLHAYYAGPRYTRMLLQERGKTVTVPSLEYSTNVEEMAGEFQQNGVL